MGCLTIPSLSITYQESMKAGMASSDSGDAAGYVTSMQHSSNKGDTAPNAKNTCLSHTTTAVFAAVTCSGQHPAIRKAASCWLSRGFNKARYRYAKDAEPRDHFEAKQRLRAVCKAWGWECQAEVNIECDLHETEPELYQKRSMRNYRVDLLCTYRRSKLDIMQIAVEVDGESHMDSKRKQKDAIRDKALALRGIRTVRFEKEEVVGKYAIPDEQLMERLNL